MKWDYFKGMNLFQNPRERIKVRIAIVFAFRKERERERVLPVFEKLDDQG